MSVPDGSLQNKENREMDYSRLVWNTFHVVITVLVDITRLFELCAESSSSQLPHCQMETAVSNLEWKWEYISLCIHVKQHVAFVGLSKAVGFSPCMTSHPKSQRRVVTWEGGLSSGDIRIVSNAQIEACILYGGVACTRGERSIGDYCMSQVFILGLG